MYDKEKHVNPHDIAGQVGIVKAQSVELEKKKVILFLNLLIDHFYSKKKFSGAIQKTK
jgi:hypothetical protein